MSVHEFIIGINRSMTNDEIDRIFEITAGDATPERFPYRTLLHFNREASSLVDAVVSAVHDMESAGFSVSRTGVADDG